MKCFAHLGSKLLFKKKPSDYRNQTVWFTIRSLKASFLYVLPLFAGNQSEMILLSQKYKICMLWKLKYTQFVTHRCRWTNSSGITRNSTSTRICLPAVCASSLYILAAILSRSGALVDVRKHFYMMKAEAELLNQCQHPRKRIHNIITRQCRIFFKVWGWLWHL